MAKTLDGVRHEASLVWRDGNPRIRFFSYGDPTDDADGRPHNRTGNQVADPAPRDLTAEELGDGSPGTLLGFLNALAAAADAAEGIA